MADENKFLKIEGGVVTGCDKSATEIAIPEGVTEIGEEAFYFCKSLASITIPDSVTKIGECAFFECQSLAGIRFGGTESQWEAVEKGYCWNRKIPVSTVHCTDGETQQPNPVVSGTANESGLLTIKGGVVTGCDKSATEIAIPEGVTEIGAWAFKGCRSLASITIPNGVTKIGAGAFEACRSLAEITIPNGVTKIGSSAFYGCESLASITIPNSVTEIGHRAFDGCKSLAGITISNGVTKIGSSAFYGCESLASITIPDSVTEIGAWAFEGCKSLAEIHFGGTESQWKAVEKGNGWDTNIPASTVRCTDGETQQTR